MVNLKVCAVITVWKLYHCNIIHRRVITLKRNLSPIFHFLMSVFFLPIGKIKKRYLSVIIRNKILIYASILVFKKSQTHTIESLHRHFNCLSELVKINIMLNVKTCTNVKYLMCRKFDCVIVDTLCCCKRIAL